MRREIGQHVAHRRRADRIAPGKRTARIADAFLHGEVDRFGRGYFLYDGIGSLVGKRAHDAHHDESGDVVDAADRHARH